MPELKEQFDLILHQNMTYLKNLIIYWGSLDTQDLLTVMFLASIMFATIAIDILFRMFINSKPAGRKTVIGKLF